MGGWPAWASMWGIAFAFYAAGKLATWLRVRRAPAPWWRHAGYLLLWPGMDGAAFLTRGAMPPGAREWAGGALAIGAGLIVLRLAVRTVVVPDRAWLAGALGMAGLVLTLHFGVFQLLSCAWRAVGIDAGPIMRTPWRASSLAEFWGRRWNTAFRDLTHAGLFEPLRGWIGPGPALAVGFVCSGVIHEAVVSIPAGTGYGGPTTYFTLHGLALLAERSSVGRQVGLGRGAAGRTFAMAALLLPVGCLFHRPFLEGVIAPFLIALGRMP